MNRVIDGYKFTSDEDVDIAQGELQRVKYISEKLSTEDPKSVLLVYNKSIQSGIFTTPVGINFLKNMQNYLKNNPAIANEDILDIPMQISYSDALFIKQNRRYESLNKMERSYKKEFRVSLLMNMLLFVMVIAMFVIALKADNPNILNYKTAVLNEYAEWEQELKEREAVIREKEKELDIDTDAAGQ